MSSMPHVSQSSEDNLTDTDANPEEDLIGCMMARILGMRMHARCRPCMDG